MRKIMLTAAVAAALMLCSCSLIYDNSSEPISDSPTTEESSDISSESSSSIGGFIVPTEFTEDDLFVQRFMTENVEKLRRLDWFNPFGTGELIEFDFVQMEKPFEERVREPYVPVPEGYPRTIAELKREAADCLTADGVERLLYSYGICERTEGENGVTAVIVKEEGHLDHFDENGCLEHQPRIIELDGKLYRGEGGSIHSFTLDGFWSTAHVISRTDDEIVFAYVYEFYNELNEATGRLKYEDGWKCSWWRDWIIDE